MKKLHRLEKIILPPFSIFVFHGYVLQASSGVMGVSVYDNMFLKFPSIIQ